MARVRVKPELLQWACERAGLDVTALRGKLPKLPAWISGQAQPTFKQLEVLAHVTHAPIGFFFLPEPPVERVPIPDFRTIANKPVPQPTPNLLDTLYICQQRQEWYREYARLIAAPPLVFVGASRLADDEIVSAADGIRNALGFSIEARRQIGTWTEALRRFIEQADELGVLVMTSSVVGGNSRRKLDPGEFRGFALADPFAPLVFINGADTKAAQMFTLAHELAHLWLGRSALSNIRPVTSSLNNVESWCNKVAAEILVPMGAIQAEYHRHANLRDEVLRLARTFKVSTLVILRRIHDIGGLSRDQLWTEYDAELNRLRNVTRPVGGNYYHTTVARVGKRFARAVVTATWEGHSSFTEAFRLLGCRKMATFRELGMSLGVGA